jgi:phosphoadenosine phosphosulfate reductase
MNSSVITSEQKQGIEDLNKVFEYLTREERIRRLYDYFTPDEVLVTSSFGTKSVYLLHLLQQIKPKQKIHFINTTYHFPETIQYRDHLCKMYDLKVVNLIPEVRQNELTRDEEWWKNHPRMCCAINKIAPLDEIKGNYKVWMSGVMGYQTEFRSVLNVFESRGDIMKFHPLIDIDDNEFNQIIAELNLPTHPLEEKGYGSVGCMHCTIKGSGRNGRWMATGQTECGLHTTYFLKKMEKKNGVDKLKAS